MCIRDRSNAATFYSSGLKGRYEEGKRGDDHVLKGNSYKILSVENGKLVEKEVPKMCIRDSVNTLACPLELLLPRVITYQMN